MLRAQILDQQGYATTRALLSQAAPGQERATGVVGIGLACAAADRRERWELDIAPSWPRWCPSRRAAAAARGNGVSGLLTPMWPAPSTCCGGSSPAAPPGHRPSDCLREGPCGRACPCARGLRAPAGRSRLRARARIRAVPGKAARVARVCTSVLRVASGVQHARREKAKMAK